MLIVINTRLAHLKQAPNWVATGTEGQNVRELVALIEFVNTALPIDITIYWIGCPAVPNQIL